MRLCNIGHEFDYETEKVIRIFFPNEKINITHEDIPGDNTVVCGLKGQGNNVIAEVAANLFSKQVTQSESVCGNSKKDSEIALARCLYKCLCDITGYSSKWGILTGIRPAKLFSATADRYGVGAAKEIFKNDYLCTNEKTELCADCAESEKSITATGTPASYSLYVSVPFCPSRCAYCSFVSHSVENAKAIIPDYLRLVKKELEATARIADRLGLRLETVYIGGGTPTALDSIQLSELLTAIRENFDFSTVRGFTVEAGRPDTVNREKLEAIRRSGATRISINPQTMNDRVLKTIGRRHTSRQMTEAFSLAREVGFDNINTDLIAGLQGDTLDSFIDTVTKIIDLSPESVTVHSLSVKRAANINREGNLPDFGVGVTAGKMVDYAYNTLTGAGLLPYYMYRQSKTVGNLENVGYARPGFEGLYNVYIMDETHTILACGASAVTKLKEPRGNNIERIFNFKYPYEYINRFDEIMSRKEGIEAYYDKHPVFDK